MVEPARFTQALRAWAGDGPRRAYADEIAAIYRGYRDGLEAAGLADAELFAWHALDALRRDPARWGATPVFVYGFDDFDPLQLDALDTLANRCGADVVASLPFERGPRGVQERRHACTSELLELGARRDRAGSARRPLRARGARRPAPRRAQPVRGRAPSTVDAGRRGRVPLRRPAQRAEIELAGARAARPAARRRRAGRHRRRAAPARRATRRCSSRSSAPTASRSRSTARVPLGHTGLGRGLLALVRCAVDPDGAGRRPARLAAHARACCASRGWPTGSRRRCAATERTAPPRRARSGRASTGSSTSSTACAEAGRRRRLPGRAGAPARAAVRRPPTAARPPSCAGPSSTTRACSWRPATRSASCSAVVEADPRTRLEPERVLAVLRELRVHLGEPPQPDRVQVAKPEAIRARRFHAVFVCGLQEGEFPARRACPSRSCPTRTGARSRAASGLRLPVREDRLDRERYLFYLCCSRAERLLVLSSRSSDEEGNPQSQSFFVEDVRDLLAAGRRRVHALAVGRDLGAGRGADRRGAGARAGRGRPARAARTPPGRADRGRGAGAAGRARRASRPSALENFADCPVKWLVRERAAARRARARPRADGARRATPTPCSQAHVRAPARGDRRAPRHAGQPAGTPSACCSRSCATSSPSSSCRPKQTRVQGRGAPARVRPASASCAARPSATAASSPSTWSCRSGSATPASRSRSRPA